MENLEFLKAQYFFSNEKFKELFKDINYIWEAIPKIAEFIKKRTNDIVIEEGTVIEQGAVIKPPCLIGKNCEIRSCSYLRGNVIIGDNCVVRSEMKNAVMMDNSHAAHLSYIGDSIIGDGVNLGASTILSNLKIDPSPVKIKINEKIFDTGLKKFGAILGDKTSTGCAVETNPGTLIGKNNLIYPHASLRGFYASNKIIKVRHNIETVERK